MIFSHVLSTLEAFAIHFVSEIIIRNNSQSHSDTVPGGLVRVLKQCEPGLCVTNCVLPVLSYQILPRLSGLVS